MVRIKSVRAFWKEPTGFSITSNAGDEYVFVHFLTPVIISGKRYREKTFVLYDKNTVRSFSSPDAPLVHDWFHARGLKALAEKHGCRFVDFQKMYEDYCKIRHSSYVAWDRIHPNQVGATLMAREFLKYCDFDYSK